MEWNGEEWIQRGTHIYGEEGEGIGSVMPLNSEGNILALGSRSDDSNGINTGKLTVYEWIDNEWLQRGQTLMGTTLNAKFGSGVSMSNDGNTICVGSESYNEEVFMDGAIHVYEWQNDLWVEKGEPFIGPSAWSFYGHWNRFSISGDGNLLIFPYTLNEQSMMDIYHWYENEWSLVLSYIPSAENPGAGSPPLIVMEPY